MTVAAGRCQHVRVAAMRRMTGDAGALVAVPDSNLPVTAAARCRGSGRIVGSVAARADGVCRRDGGRQRCLVAVAPDARVVTTRDERVRLMAAHARVVVGGARSGRLRVASRARGESDGGRRMRAVAIEATLGARVLPMLRGSFFMTAGAIGCRDRR